MDFLSKESAPISAEFWQKIDQAVIGMARNVLVGRKFLDIYGPLGAGAQSVPLDDLSKAGESDGFIVKNLGRKYVELPIIYDDFALLWRDIESSAAQGLPVDLSAALRAAAACAKKEDEFIFLGNKALGYEGLVTAEGTMKMKKSDWGIGDNPMKDIVAGLSFFAEMGLVGRTALIISPSLLLQLQRIQEGTGITAFDRLKNLLGGRLFYTPVLDKDTAVLVNAEPQNMDLAIGQDMATAYLETKDLNHYFRILETALLRIKNKNAVVLYE